MTKPDIDTDFNQFADAAEFHNRRSSDRVVATLEDCPTEGCAAVFVLERRIDRHRQEIEEIKGMVKANGVLVEKNSADTSEILEIVSMAKSLFRAIGWTTDKIKTILSVVGAVSAVIAWFKYKG